LLFAVSLTAKEVYCCMSQYPSTNHTITNVKHLLKWRYVRHTAPTLQKTPEYWKAWNVITKALSVCYEVYTENRSYIYGCRRKILKITHSEYVSVALVIQHVMRMSCIILLSLASLVVRMFWRISQKQFNFQIKDNFYSSLYIASCNLLNIDRVISKVGVRKGREAGTIHRWFTGAFLLGCLPSITVWVVCRLRGWRGF